MKPIDTKIAIVTGGASGIGAGCSEILAAAGAKVVVADVNIEGARRQADLICNQGGTAVPVHVDLGEEGSIRQMIDFTVSTFGGLDILHNNAAATHLSIHKDFDVEHSDVVIWDDTMRINVRGMMLAIKFSVPHMRARGGGSIINMSSGSGLTGTLSYTAYGVSKAAIVSLTQHVAAQYGKDNIRCNAIAPGLIVTPATEVIFGAGPARDMMLRHHLTTRLGKPADIGYAVLFLASDEAAFITGHVLRVDGGLSAHQPYDADQRAAQI